MTAFLVEHFDTLVGIIGLIFAGILALPKVEEWSARAQTWRDDNKLRVVYDIVLGVVAQVYQEYVRDMKAEGRFDGDAKDRAVSTALALSKNVLRERGVDIAMEILPALIEKAVSRLKSEAPAKVPAAAPFSPGPELI